jgi:homoserine dehydrogenase
MRVALIGYGNVGRAFARLLQRKHSIFPFRIVAIHTARHGSAYDPKGLPVEPAFGTAAASVADFLDQAKCEVVCEITTLNPATGEPALSHIRAAFARGRHVITANKGPIAHAYSALKEEARIAGVEFHYESTVMDGAPVFNMVRNCLPGVKILGFTGVVNSTTKIVIGAMREGKSMAEGIAEAQNLGVAEADADYDIDGWDSAAKTAVLANVLMDAWVTPLDVVRQGIRDITPDRVQELKRARQTLCLISRGQASPEGLKLEVRPEVLDETDLLASVHGTSNPILLHTDLMGSVGTVSLSPGVDQTAYGLFSDLVDIAKNV